MYVNTTKIFWQHDSIIIIFKFSPCVFGIHLRTNIWLFDFVVQEAQSLDFFHNIL